MKSKGLFIVLILAAILRFSFLGSIPAGFTPDEAVQGYTAYSLLQTGQDEWGVSWPLTSFRSFADYKAPLQTYLMIPSVAIFGLNSFAVRLPSAFFGVLAVLAIYLLSRELFGSKKIKLGKFSFTLPLLAAFLLTISPWHFQFSRTALEVNLSSFLFPFGLYLFLRGIKQKKACFFAWTALFWGINMYSYHAAKMFTPVFALITLFIYRSQLLKFNFKKLIPASLIFLFFFIPAYTSTLFGDAGARGGDLIISNLSLRQLEEISDSQYLSPLNQIHPQLSRVFHNKAWFILDRFVENYTSYFTPSFWFTEGGREITYSTIPGRGLLFLWQFPFILLAVYSLLDFKKEKNKNRFFILLAWALISAVPAALTKEGYRPNRAGSFALLWEMLTAVGLVYFFQLIPKKVKSWFTPILLIFISICFVFYIEDYALAAPIKFPSSLSYGYQELMGKLDQYDDNHNILIERGAQSQSYVAFYKQLDPLIFQSHSKDWWLRFKDLDLLYLDMMDDYSLLNYRFKTVSLPADLEAEDLIIVLPAEKMREDYLPQVIDQVDYPDRTPAFYLLQSYD